MDSYRQRVEEVRAQNRYQAVTQAAERDADSHCCGAPVRFSPEDSTERTWRYRCSQCGLLQDR